MEFRIADTFTDSLGRLTGEVPAATVYLLAQVVEHAHPITLRQQRIGHMRADEAGPAGDEHALTHVGVPED